MSTNKSSSSTPLLIRAEKLVSEFKKTDLTGYPKVHTYKKKSDAVMWVMWVLGEKFPNNEWTPADVISNILLEVLNISSEAKSVKIALNPFIGTLVHQKDFGGETLYKIMEKGKEHLRDMAGEGKTTIYRITGATPRADKQFLADVIKSSKSELKIVDPFFGSKTLANIEKFYFGKPIKLLTTQVNLERHQSRSTFDSDLSDFKTQHKNFQVRIFPNNPKEIHDRYIIMKNSIILVGHGIKDLGGKESFILTFEGKDIGESIIADLDKKFELRWNKSTAL